MKLKRESNYDLLRLASCIAAIMIHISGAFVSSYSEAFADNAAMATGGH